MKSNNQFFGALSRTLCCLCAIVLCMGCLSSGTYGWYNETASASGVVQFGEWTSAPVNLLSNGDFAGGLDGWTRGNSASNTFETDEGYLKLARAGKAPYVQQKATGTYPAGTYTVSGKVMVSHLSGGAVAEIEISFKNASGTAVNEPKKYSFKGANMPATAETWTDFSFDVVVSEDSTDLSIMLKHTLSSTGYICYDDISITQAQSVSN